MGVEPVQLVYVEYGRALADLFDIEPLASFFEGEDLFAVLRSPAHLGKIVDQGFGHIAVLAILGDMNRLSVSALGELSLFGIEHQGGMAVMRRGFAKGFEYKKLFGGVVNMVFASENQAHLHVDIIDDHGKIIGGHAIRFDDDHVPAKVCAAYFDLAFDGIMPFYFLGFLYPEANGRDSAFFFELFFFVLAEVAIAVVVANRLVLSLLLLFHQRELVRSCVAKISKAAGQELVCHRFVMIDFLGLAIGRIRTADVGTFVPGDTEPLQTFDDVFGVRFVGALVVGVFQAKDELATVFAGVEIVVQRRSGCAKMQGACRRRGDSYSSLSGF